MKIKMFLSILIAFSLIESLKAMQPHPGTVINPMHQTGQFTVSAVDPVSSNISGLVPIITSVTQNGSSIAQPAIISFAAGQAPWWALTISTGYLLICQCDITNPALLSACFAGAGYATGAHATNLVKKIVINEYAARATAAILATSCLGLSYATNINLVQDVFFAAAQAMGLEAIIQLSQQLLTVKKSPTKTIHHTNSEMLNVASQAIGTNLHTLLAELLRCYNPTELLRILLYQQAYRLALNGYQAANDLCIHLKPNYRFLDHRTLACTII